MSRVGGGAVSDGTRRENRSRATSQRLNKEEIEKRNFRNEILQLVDAPLGETDNRVLKINVSMQAEKIEDTNSTKIVVNSWIVDDDVRNEENAANLTIFMAMLTMQHIHDYTLNKRNTANPAFGIDPFDIVTSLVKGANDEPIFTEAVSVISKDTQTAQRERANMEKFYNDILTTMLRDMKALGMLFLGRKRIPCEQGNCKSYKLFFVVTSTVVASTVVALPLPQTEPTDMDTTAEAVALDVMNSLLDSEVACEASLLTPFE